MAQALTWDASGSGTPTDGAGTWNTTGFNWYNGGPTDVAWSSGGTAQFGVTAGSTASTVTVSGSPTIGGLTFQSQAYTLSSGSLALTGPVPVTVNASSGGTIGSTFLTGAGGLTMAGPGVLQLGTGAALASNFTGSVVVSGGTLVANGTANSTDPTGTPLGNTQNASRTITVNSGGVLQFAQGNELGGGSSFIKTPLVINSGGLVIGTVVNSNNVLGPVTLSGGTITGTFGANPANDNYLTYQFTAGSVTVNTAPSVLATYPAASLSSTGYGYNLGNGTSAMGFSTTFNVAFTGTGGTVSSYPDLTVDAILADSPGSHQFTGGSKTAGLVKIGAGTMLLLGSDSYTGTTTVNGGVLELGNSAAMWLSTFNSNGTGALSFGTLANATFGGLTGAGTLALTDITGSFPVVLTVSNSTNNSTTFSGTLSDAGLSGGLTKAGGGTLTISGSNTYTGATQINTGALALTGSLGNTTVTVGGGADVDGRQQRLPRWQRRR